VGASIAGQARRFVGEVLDDVAGEQLRADALLTVSELASNVAHHTSTETATIHVAVHDDGVCIGVTDSDPDRQPVVRDVDITALTGRGLRLVEIVAEDWGVSTTDEGKTVWCLLVRPPIDVARSPIDRNHATDRN
jgi:anti-sigma regulatory factor (Ser/Thr protein kinase)